MKIKALSQNNYRLIPSFLKRSTQPAVKMESIKNNQIVLSIEGKIKTTITLTLEDIDVPEIGSWAIEETRKSYMYKKMGIKLGNKEPYKKVEYVRMISLYIKGIVKKILLSDQQVIKTNDILQDAKEIMVTQYKDKPEVIAE